MPIAALPPATVHLLGSAQVLTTPNSLVKELIDNALDARASSIDILISPDTLDKIEVRDNGHGIAQEDLDSLGRRGHTSKLRSFEELRDIGGISLGFRGEALASAVELGEVTVTTRTDGEPVATVVKLKAPGGIAHQSRASHPIGTTVSVTKFMAKLPIRRQQALKQATKTLTKLKELLQSYALARPTVRFNFRTTKGNKGAWSFAPRPNDGIREAVSQVIGRDAAVQCVSRSIVPNNDDETSSENAQFQLEAFLPKSDADPSKIGSGQYFCIDARPVAYDKGTIKKIVTMFKKYLRGSIGETATEKLKNPFLRLSIICPKSSYDPNVEPAKDDVLFENEDILLQSIEELFKGVYGNCVPPPPATPVPRITSEKLDNFELLLNRKPPTSPKIQSAESSAKTAIPKSGSLEIAYSPLQKSDIEEPMGENKKRKWGFNMSKDFAELAEDATKSSRIDKAFEANKLSKPDLMQTENTEIQTESKNGLNPWVIAKINTPLVQEKRGHERQTQPINIATKKQTAFEGSSAIPGRHVHNPLLVPFQPPQFHTGITRVSSPPLPIVAPNLGLHPNPHTATVPRDTVDNGVPDEEEMLLREHTPTPRPVNDFISARHLPQDLLMTPPATHNTSVRKFKGPNRPFVPPLKYPETSNMQKVIRQTTLDQLPGVQKSHGTETGLSTASNEELNWAMAFEKRKEEATRRHKEELRSVKRKNREEDLLLVDNPRSSPHKNRYNAAIASLEMPEVGSEPFKTSMKDGDPRAYLIKRQKSMGAQSVQPGVAKMKRMKTNLLPMETIPESSHMYDVAHTVSTSVELVRTSLAESTNFDNYASRGVQNAGLDVGSVDEASAIATRLQNVVKIWQEADKENKIEVEYKLNNLLERTISVVM